MGKQWVTLAQFPRNSASAVAIWFGFQTATVLSRRVGSAHSIRVRAVFGPKNRFSGVLVFHYHSCVVGTSAGGFFGQKSRSTHKFTSQEFPEAQLGRRFSIIIYSVNYNYSLKPFRQPSRRYILLIVFYSIKILLQLNTLIAVSTFKSSKIINSLN